MEIFLVTAAILSFAIVVLSVYPGVLFDLLLIAILTSILWIPALVIARMFLHDADKFRQPRFTAP